MELKSILNKVEEEWVMGTKATRAKEYREIFKNPSKSELEDIIEFGGERLGSDFRFIAIKDGKDVYVSSADVFHITMTNEIEGLGSTDIYENFSGIADWNRGIVRVKHYSDFYYEEGFEKYLYKVSTDILEGRYDFLIKYGFDLSLIEEEAMKQKRDLEKED